MTRALRFTLLFVYLCVLALAATAEADEPQVLDTEVAKGPVEQPDDGGDDGFDWLYRLLSFKWF